MKFSRILICCIGLGILGLVACREELLEPLPDLLDDYFPLELNRPVYYRMDSVVLYREVGGVRYDSSRTDVRETLVETFTGADGSTIYRGERWERPNAGTPYRFKQTFTVTRTGSTAVRSEDNLTFTKLVTPVRQNVRWDGNKAFDEFRDIFAGAELVKVYEGWDYRYTNVDSTVNLRTGVELDRVVVVQQAAMYDNKVDYRRAYEWYAPGVGLVERFVDARHSQCINRQTNCDDLSWDEKADKGYILHQTYVGRD